MFGFPKENIEDWKYDIQQALQLGVEHISAYSLMYEEGTPLYKMLEQGKIEEIDEELSRNMYDTLVDMLTLSGYEHYEISNLQTRLPLTTQQQLLERNSIHRTGRSSTFLS